MSDTKKNIQLVYVVNARIPNVRAHGIQIAHTCEALGMAGVDVTLATPMFYGEHPSLENHYGITQTFKHRKILAIDIPHIGIRYVIRNFSFFLFVNIYVICRFLGTLFTRKKLVVYVRGEVVLALIPLTYIIPIFFETHQIRNYEQWYKRALRRVRGIVVVTKGLKEKFVSEYGIHQNKILVARDAVDIHKFSHGQEQKNFWTQYGIREGKKIVLYSGTLSPEKGVDTLAEAASLVQEDIQIVFLGGTPEQVALFQKKYGHIKNISILGRVNHTDVPMFVASAHVLILPDSADYSYSNLYTSPMKLFEYMASGRPIVASRVPSLLEVLDEDSATFFESGSIKSLAQSIQAVLLDVNGATQKSKRAREIVSAFTWKKRAHIIVEHIQLCL